MDDPLPSYQSAINPDPWELIAPYLPSDDLCSAILVCQRWHTVFAPSLWGAPASHFGAQHDAVYVALTRFKRNLHKTRLCVRELTHTLHLPPAHAEAYGGPHAEWLRDCLERLPRLQSLLVNGLPFFDHASLLTLKYSTPWGQQSQRSAFPVFCLRLLDASQCSNATSTGLSEALSHFPNLVVLNLSRTLAAKHESVLSKLRQLRHLRVLNLRGLGLKDSDLVVVASGITTRVRSLDISENQLTDASAHILLDKCMREVSVQGRDSGSLLPPVRHGRPTADVNDLAAEDLDHHLRQKLTRGFFGCLAVENAADMGITHLYLSDSGVAVEGCSALLRAQQLQALDIGNLPMIYQQQRQSSNEENDTGLLPLGVEKLTPVLARYGSEKLSYLRISYRIVTEDDPPGLPSRNRTELDGSAAASVDAPQPPWVDPGAPRLELDAFNTGVYDLPAPSSNSSATTRQLATEAIGDASPGQMESESELESEIEREIIQAPEPMDPPMSPPSPLLSHDQEQANNDFPRGSIHCVEDQRTRLHLRQSLENRLHPGMLPKVQTLVLTDVPSITHKEEVVQRLQQFIKDCAEEVAMAKLRAKNTYTLPPGRSREAAEREHTRSLFALRRIVFEMAPPEAAPEKATTSGRSHWKSSTEDADSEAFWEAASNDFSFFREEECGLPISEPALEGPTPATKQPTRPPRPLQPEAPTTAELDVVTEISMFRRERKAAYCSALQRGAVDPHVEGYWPGDITVVRKAAGGGAVGSLDYYGHRLQG